MARLAFTFGRFNPITIGHEKLINTLKGMQLFTHDRYLFLSESHDNKSNPLSFDYRYQLCHEAFYDYSLIISKQRHKDFFAAVKWVEEMGYSEIDVLVGSDRYAELSKRIPQYNGTLYKFLDIRVHQIKRDDSDAASSMSGTKMREAAINNDYEAFVAGLPMKLRKRAQEIFEKVKEGCTRKTLERI